MAESVRALEQALKVIHLSQTDSGAGAGRAAYRIHQSLRATGVDSSMVVGVRGEGTDVIAALDSWLGRNRLKMAAFLEAKLSRHLRASGSGYVSPAAFGGFEPCRDARVRAADIVCLYWINGGFIRPEGLTGLTMPLVWRLSDAWPFTGGCHYPGSCERFIDGCGECPQLASRGPNDHSRRLWERKVKAWRDIDLTIVAPSQWMADLARRSALFCSSRIEYIATGVDTDIFRARDRAEVRTELGLPGNRKLLVFGAAGATSDPRKGWRELMAAIGEVVSRSQGQDWHIAVFGNTEDLPSLPLPATAMGILTDQDRLAQLYSSADVVAVPSVEDNLPQVALEALSCGTPIVAFHIGGLPDAVVHRENGWLAKRGDIGDFADGLVWAMSTGDVVRTAARQHAEIHFSQRIQSIRYAQLLSELAQARRECPK